MHFLKNLRGILVSSAISATLGRPVLTSSHSGTSVMSATTISGGPKNLEVKIQTKANEIQATWMAGNGMLATASHSFPSPPDFPSCIVLLHFGDGPFSTDCNRLGHLIEKWNMYIVLQFNPINWAPKIKGFQHYVKATIVCHKGFSHCLQLAQPSPRFNWFWAKFCAMQNTIQSILPTCQMSRLNIFLCT